MQLLKLSLVVTLLSCSPPTKKDATGPLRAGIATVVVDVPVGAPTGGYSRNRSSDDPGSRWAKNFPSTTGVHTDATARAIAFANDVTRTAIVRLDVCLMTPSLRNRIRQKLDEAGEPAKFIVQATHTHAQVARYFEPVHLTNASGPDFVAFGMDVYDAELDDRLASAAAASVLEAFSTLRPVSVKAASVEAGELNNDRRCENDPVYGKDFRDTALTVVRVDEVDEAGAPQKPFAALLHFAAHGTVLSGSNTLLSTDGPGAMELAASDALGIPVIYLQGAAGDVSPKGSPLGFAGTQQLEWMGRTGARLAKAAYDQAAPEKAPAHSTLMHVERGLLLTREALGYTKGQFPEHGGIACGVGGPGCGVVVSTPELGGQYCAPIEPRPKPRPPMTLLQVGDVAMITLPGEPSTAVGQKAAAALEPLGVTTRLPLGYAQDHFGYLLEQDDFLRGGYEPTVSPWGWRTGQYLVSEAQKLVETRAQAQEPPTPGTPPSFTPREFEASDAAPAIVSSPTTLERTQAAVLVFTGGDPGLGTPSVSIEEEQGGAYAQVMAAPGRPLSNGPEVIRRYEATPTVDAQPMAATRRHQWTARWELLPTQRLGRYRVVVTGRAKVGAEVQRYRLESSPFSVTPSRSIAAMNSSVLPDGRVLLAPRYAPNPMRFDRGDPVGNFRLWDETSRPDVGMTARGGTLRAEVRQGTGAPITLDATWSDAEAGFVLQLPSGATGAFEVRMSAGAIVDGLGNTNGSALTVSVSR